MIHLELVALDGVKFSEDVYEVQVPTMSGLIGVLPKHMPLVSIAVPGVLTIRKKATDLDDMQDVYAINGGVLEVSDDTLRILVDEADHADEINEAEAKAAYERAQKLKAEAKDEVSLQQAQSLVDRSAVRLQVAGLRRTRRR
jgi:F-type H+-transporting ATPase subunit epsilon